MAHVKRRICSTAATCINKSLVDLILLEYPGNQLVLATRRLANITSQNTQNRQAYDLHGAILSHATSFTTRSQHVKVVGF